jgi:hypothetical protein
MEPKILFNDVNEDVNAVAWISENELLVATEDSLLICDTRMLFSIKTQID